MRKIYAWLMVVICISVATLLASILILVVQMFYYVPNDDTIVDYVEELIQQDLDKYNYQIIEKDFSTNLRDYSLFVIIELDDAFEFIAPSSKDLHIETSHLHQALQTVYGIEHTPESYVSYVDAEKQLYCIFDISRRWLIVDYQ